MKALCLLLAAVFSLATTTANAVTMKLAGSLSWKIFEPNATFTLSGGLQNLGPGTSGSIKLVLWATSKPYPSTGYPVAEYNLGTIGSGYQFEDFTVRTTSKLPNLTGPYYFTITVLEYTTAGWATRLIAPGSMVKTLTIGNFNDQPKWVLPKAKVINPPGKVKFGNILQLTPKATGELFPLPVEYQIPMRVDIRVKDNANLFAGSSGKATFKYGTKKGPFNNKRVKFGNLALDYKGEVGPFKATDGGLALYFQSATSGTYKRTEKDTFGKFVTWGTFTFKD